MKSLVISEALKKRLESLNLQAAYVCKSKTSFKEELCLSLDEAKEVIPQLGEIKEMWCVYHTTKEGKQFPKWRLALQNGTEVEYPVPVGRNRGILYPYFYVDISTIQVIVEKNISTGKERLSLWGKEAE